MVPNWVTFGAINPVPGLQRFWGHPKENFRNEQIAYTYKHGIDSREITDGGGRLRANPGYPEENGHGNRSITLRRIAGKFNPPSK